jgi:DNA-binding transcriptional LysR family regulator
VDKFDAMQTFVRVVEKGSFSAVAKERGIGQPAVSKQISALENELGTELIHRTSRSIAPTEPGRDFYESALHILDDFENATSRIEWGGNSEDTISRFCFRARTPMPERSQCTITLIQQPSPSGRV